jgi:hypothetical protein
MPNTDSCEPQVIRALNKIGWSVIKKTYAIALDKSGGFVYADLQMRQKSNPRRIMIVEVKCFSDRAARLNEFYRAVGQYVVYRNGLQRDGFTGEIYLALPIQIYKDLIQLDPVRDTLDEIKMKLILIDLETETVIAWIN